MCRGRLLCGCVLAIFSLVLLPTVLLSYHLPERCHDCGSSAGSRGGGAFRLSLQQVRNRFFVITQRHPAGHTRCINACTHPRRWRTRRAGPPCPSRHRNIMRLQASWIPLTLVNPVASISCTTRQLAVARREPAGRRRNPPTNPRRRRGVASRQAARCAAVAGGLAGVRRLPLLFAIVVVRAVVGRPYHLMSRVGR